MASLHVTPRNVPYCPLRVADAFKDLTARQRLYAHYLMRAGWQGTAVVARQLSNESLPLLRLYLEVLSTQPSPAEFRKAVLAADSTLTEDAVDQFLEYGALLYSNMGNYLSFGDSKFVPSCDKEQFCAIVRAAKQKKDENEEEEKLIDAAYDLAESKLSLNYPPKGVSAYYSDNITEADAVLANEFLSMKKMEGVNTRVWKSVEAKDGGKVTLTIRIASAQQKKMPAEEFKGVWIELEYGDHAAEMQKVADELKKALPYTENATQTRMLNHYIKHFEEGDVDDHKSSQREWVKDLGPAVESNIGFIESYRDPSGVRSEWEGFVAVVNKEQSKQYGELVANAERFIAKLPWGKAFEKDSFSSPDFTSLDVLGFASSGIPIGINIPNYDDIRQTFGFKNVYLSNVVSAVNWNEKLLHISEEDWETYKTSIAAAMSVNVGIHELLGHGTGKLLREEEDGTFNFDRAAVTDPLSPDPNSPVSTWYKPGDTFGSVFGGIGSSYEECRAEAVSLFLSVEPDILALFNKHTPQEQQDTIYICWLNMVRAGLVGLEFYTPETQQWRQAHMRARFAILQALLQAPNPICFITLDEKEGVRIALDGSRIATDGIAAIGDLLVHLNVNKATANAQRGIAYYEKMTTVDETFVNYRKIVMEKRKPRKQYVQPHTSLLPSGEDVVVREFDGSVDGALEAFLARHKEMPI